MRAPRMTVGVFIDETSRSTFASDLADVGHTVTELIDPADAADYELIVLSVAESALPELVDVLSARARRGQIYIHTALGYDVQVLDPLETSGAIVGAAYELSRQHWVTDAVDELGETIVGLLIGELGGTGIQLRPTQRTRLAAALTYLGFARTVKADATSLLFEATGSTAIVEDLAAEPQHHGLATIDGPSGLEAQYGALEDPGVRRAFRELVRRSAEQTRADDAELWAIQQEGRS